MKIALAVQYNLTTQNESTDDWLIKKSLEELGVEVDIINWRDKSIDLKQYDSIMVASTWNLHKYPQEFLEWIETCDSDKKRLINAADLLRIGMNKDEYLTLLLNEFGFIYSEQGSVTPSEFIKDNDFSLTTKIELLKAKYPAIWAGDIVLKPIISADGDDTYRFTTDQQLISKDKNRYKPFSAADSIMKDLITRKDSRGVIIQPFIPSVEKYGEYQLVFIGGNFSHATVKPKGFKNNNTNERQPVAPKDLPKCMYEFANKISQFLQGIYPDGLSRLRLDFFAGDNGPILCEAEMVEPNTNIRRLAAKQQKEVIKKYAAEIFSRTEQLQAIAKLNEILGNESDRYNSLTKNRKFCHAILKLHDAKNKILVQLVNEPILNDKAKKSFPSYFKKCLDALVIFEAIKSPTRRNKLQLLKSLNVAIEDFTPDVQSYGKNSVLMILNYVIKFFVELFTRRHFTNLFFAEASPRDKLEATHQDINLAKESPLNW